MEKRGQAIIRRMQCGWHWWILFLIGKVMAWGSLIDCCKWQQIAQNKYFLVVWCVECKAPKTGWLVGENNLLEPAANDNLTWFSWTINNQFPPWPSDFGMFQHKRLDLRVNELRLVHDTSISRVDDPNWFGVWCKCKIWFFFRCLEL